MNIEPCPFCGGEARIYMNDSDLDNIMWYCMCTNDRGCNVMPITLDQYSKEEAAAAWNTRHVGTCKLHEVDALTQTLSMVNGCAWSECSECGCLTPDDSDYCVNCGRKVEG